MTFAQLMAEDTYVVRTMRLAPGEASPWHVDPCRRYSVVLGGDRLTIEFSSNTHREELVVHSGMAGWDEPESRVHRAVNTGTQDYVEVVTFIRASPGLEVQPTSPPPV